MAHLQVQYRLVIPDWYPPAESQKNTKLIKQKRSQEQY
jgi:hypothetical protein